MFHPIYTIELRQNEVTGLNARHYFWALKKNLPGGGNRVLGELHGRPADWKTGKPKSFSLGGDQLRFYKRIGEGTYDSSLKLPFAIAIQDHKENVLARWNEGIRAGKLANKTRTFYDPTYTNSNAVATTVGRAMGFEMRRIIDPRVDAPNPFVPGIGIDLLVGQDGRQSPFMDNRTSVGWDAKIEDRFGNEPDPGPFRDNFREDIPF